MEENEIKKLVQEIQRLRKLVYFDDLTEILNRRGFKEEADKVFDTLSFKNSEVERRIGKNIPFSIIFIDIDNFKSVNDTFGHDTGDEVLKNVAKIIVKRIRRTDICARWGGEEFVAALPGANINAAKKVAEALHKDIELLAIPYNNEKKT